MDAHSNHFLLVEDDEDHAEFLIRTLRRVRPNSRIVHLRDGAEAIAYLDATGVHAERTTPDVVLLDLKLPKVDGHEVLSHIKTDQRLRTIPVVVLTTSDAECDRKRAYENHANSYLVKPVDFERFRELIHQVGTYWGEWNRTFTDDV